MKSLNKFYSNLDFEIDGNEEQYFVGNLTNEQGNNLVVIHTGNVHRVYCEQNGMFCSIIPNSEIDFEDVQLVQKILSVSVFLKANFPNVHRQILELDIETTG